MKIYDIKELYKIAREQNFNFISLENEEREKIVPFNKAGTPIEPQIKRITRRLESNIVADGRYFVLMGDSIRAANHTPNKFMIVKGEYNEAKIVKNEVPFTETKEILSVSNALSMISEVANLRAENKYLQRENDFLYEQVSELQLEISGLEANQKEPINGGGILGNIGSHASGFMNEHAPTLIALADKYFSQKDRELSLKEKGNTPAQPAEPTKRKINFEIGSAQHLQLIKNFLDAGNEEQLNKHLDILEQHNKELHDNFCLDNNIENE
jgi:hypothetical protein